MNYVKFFKKITKNSHYNSIKFIAIVIVDAETRQRVTEHINLDWLLQATTKDIFSWMYNLILRKQRYTGGLEALYIYITFNPYSEKKKKAINNIGIKLNLNTH